MSTPHTRPKSPFTCGYCITGAHDHCPHAIANGDGSAVPCHCPRKGCGQDVVLCLRCKKVHDDVSSKTWTCIDKDACEARVQARLDGNPVVQQIIRHQERGKMAETETRENKTAAAKAEKPKTYCLVTGQETKGGKFLPGMDARYVSIKVAEVLSDESKEQANRENVYGISESLGKKFDKSLGLARDKAAKKAQIAADKEAAKVAKQAAAEAAAETAPAEDADAA